MGWEGPSATHSRTCTPGVTAPRRPQPRGEGSGQVTPVCEEVTGLRQDTVCLALEKTLMPGGIGGKRRREQQRMRWLDGITESMDMSLSELREQLKIDLKTRWGELEEGQRLQSGSSWTLSIGLAVEVAEGD